MIPKYFRYTLYHNMIYATCSISVLKAESCFCFLQKIQKSQDHQLRVELVLAFTSNQ